MKIVTTASTEKKNEMSEAEAERLLDKRIKNLIRLKELEALSPPKPVTQTVSKPPPDPSQEIINMAQRLEAQVQALEKAKEILGGTAPKQNPVVEVMNTELGKQIAMVIGNIAQQMVMDKINEQKVRKVMALEESLNKKRQQIQELENRQVPIQPLPFQQRNAIQNTNPQPHNAEYIDKNPPVVKAKFDENEKRLLEEHSKQMGDVIKMMGMLVDKIESVNKRIEKLETERETKIKNEECKITENNKKTECVKEEKYNNNKNKSVDDDTDGIQDDIEEDIEDDLDGDNDG